MLGAVAAPAAVLIRPDGYVAWVGDGTQTGLADALTTWFGPPDAAGAPVRQKSICPGPSPSAVRDVNAGAARFVAPQGESK